MIEKHFFLLVFPYSQIGERRKGTNAHFWGRGTCSPWWDDTCYFSNELQNHVPWSHSGNDVLHVLPDFICWWEINTSKKENFSFEAKKKAIAMNDHNKHSQRHELITTQSKYMQSALSAGKMHQGSDWRRNMARDIFGQWREGEIQTRAIKRFSDNCLRDCVCYA